MTRISHLLNNDISLSRRQDDQSPYTAVELGYYDKQSATITGLFDDADDAFFRKILYNKQHVIDTYLPERSDIVYTMCNRQHNKDLIPKTSDLNDRHFLIRLLYKDGY